MQTFEWIIVLLIAAAFLAELARRIGAPYPILLALGGAGVAFLPAAPRWTLDPQLALALFVAPVLLDAAYNASPRDLRANWRPVAGLVIAAVGTIVAPPDAAAATAVLRQVRLPHRVLNVLEGESLLNDASALFIYRVALTSAIAGSLSFADYMPLFLITVFGSIAAGIVLAIVLRPVTTASDHVPISLILQFAFAFAVWVLALAERVGLSGILTMVAFAMTMARGGGPRIPARMRVPSPLRGARSSSSATRKSSATRPTAHSCKNWTGPSCRPGATNSERHGASWRAFAWQVPMAFARGSGFSPAASPGRSHAHYAGGPLSSEP